MFGWSTKGYYVCPVCKEDTTSSWQAGKFCYLGHCKWLLWDHEWRQNEIAFFNDIELQQRPREWSGDETLAQVNQLDFAPLGKFVNKTRPDTRLN
ncbi:hypothetical protein ACFX1X_022575 [Malus domestica]